MEHPTPWFTIRDAYGGIETFLLDGPKSMTEIATHARRFGSTDFDTASFVRALVGADRLEATFSPDHPSGVYRLSPANYLEVSKGVIKGSPRSGPRSLERKML